MKFPPNSETIMEMTPGCNGGNGASVQNIDRTMSGFGDNDPIAASALRLLQEKATKGGSLNAFSAGLHLITDYVSDDLGRVIQQRGPWHEVQLREAGTKVTRIRRVEFTAYDENHETRRATGYRMMLVHEPNRGSISRPIKLFHDRTPQ